MLWTLLVNHARPYRGRILLVGLLLLAVAGSNLYLPNLTADIINNGVVKGNVPYIWRTGGVMLAITLVVSVLQVTATYFSAGIAMGIGRDLRGHVYASVQEFSAQEMNHFGSPSLITRNTNDVQQIQMFLVVALTILASAPLMAVGGVIMALYENAQLSLLLVVIVPLMAVVMGALLYFAVPLFRAMQWKIDRINQVLREQIHGIRVIRAFVRSDHERDRFETANQDLTATSLRVTRIFALAMPSIFLILNLSSVAVIWFGGHLVDQGSMPIGNLTAFLTYLLLILMAVLMASMMTIMVPRASACAERIQQVLDSPVSIVEKASTTRPLTPDGRVELRAVDFQYPGAERPVLTGIGFTLEAGTWTAVIGATGSGKSTLVNLLPRFFDASQGEVLVNGVDVKDQALEDLWSQFGLVPQQAYLFQGTIGANLRLGRQEASDEELWHALEVAQAADFVRAMPGGLSEAVAQGGTNVSGGQRQRLAIARALVRKPLIYIFDDCFSALDAATDARLRAALRGDIARSTVLLVSQRVSTIRDADQIVVLDDGHVVGKGTHDQLMRENDTYREIVDSQLRGQAGVA